MSPNPQNPPAVSLLKLLKFTAEDPLSYFMQLAKQGDIIKIPLAKKRYLINNPEAIQHIFITNFDNYTKVGTNYRRLSAALGPGLLTNSNTDWKKRREDLQPMLYYKNLAKYSEVINHYTQETLDNWEKKRNLYPYFNLANELFVLVAKISAAVLFGIELANQTSSAVKLVHIGNSFIAKSLSIAHWYPTLGNLRFRLTQKKLDNMLLAAFQNKKNPNLPAPLLQNVVEEYENKKITAEEFLGDVKNFFVAGHETTASALSWCFYCLLTHPEKLAMLQQEINEVLGSQFPAFEKLQELHYTDLVLSETWRLYPPIWLIERRAIADDILAGYTIPAMATVVISPYTIHRHPNYWEQPNIFYPERFTAENSVNRNKYVYIPFGTGPRVCIGKQLATMISKIVLTSILQRFEIKLAQQKVKPEALVTLRPKGGIWVRIAKKSS